MGYSHRNVVKMCYNGQNMWDMGWFQQRRYAIDLDDTKNGQEIVNLAFYGDYPKTQSDQPVILRYRNFYMTFNVKRGVNAETKEYPDMLLIVQEVPGEYHVHTNLETALGVGDEPYQMDFGSSNKNKDSVFIEVCSYTPGSTNVPDYLTVSVGRSKGGCSGALTVSRQDND